MQGSWECGLRAEVPWNCNGGFRISRSGFLNPGNIGASINNDQYYGSILIFSASNGPQHTIGNYLGPCSTISKVQSPCLLRHMLPALAIKERPHPLYHLPNRAQVYV